MGWVTLIVVFTFFGVGLLCFLWASFFVPREGAAKIILGGIDGLLLWPMKAIVPYLFPSNVKTE